MSSPTCAVLFGGIGGELLGLERAGWTPLWVSGLERAGWTPLWVSELAPFPSSVLAARWPEVPNLGDITTIEWSHVARPSLLVGGFPCQDISNAHTNGTRLALAGLKSGLWEHYRRAVEALEPRWVVVENVSAFARWVPDVRADLSELGYASVPLELSAGTFGAPHKRPRIFVVAHADSEGEPLRAIHAKASELRPVPRGGGDWRVTPPGGLRVADGIPARMDRLHALGNSVVPAVVEWIGRELMEADQKLMAVDT